MEYSGEIMTDDKIKTRYNLSLAISGLVLIILIITSLIFFIRDMEPYMKYESKYQIDAKIVVYTGIDWIKLDDSIPTPKDGDPVKIIHVGEREDICTIVYNDDNGKTVAYASLVPLEKLSYHKDLLNQKRHETFNYRIYKKTSFSEKGFLLLIFIIIAVLIFAIYNIPLILVSARLPGSYYKRRTTGIYINSGFILVSVILILLQLC